MRKIKNYLLLGLVGMLLIMLTSCGGNDVNNSFGSIGGATEDESGSDILDGESYNKLEENPYVFTEYANASYFSMDSNTAAYANLRRQIEQGSYINDVIKTDELINYFSYNLPTPTEDDFSAVGALTDCPWNETKKILTLGVSTKKVELDEDIPNNIVFLIDVSGSMSASNKLALVKQSFKLCIDELNPDDLVSIVTYASGINVRCSGVKASNKSSLNDIIDELKANGGTNGGDGLERAYRVAEENLIEGGNNRIIIASDGDFNIGMSNQTELQEYMSSKLEKGIYVTTLGFGMGNYKDTTMETLAKYGNGTYAYIDSLAEAKKVLVDDLRTNLIVVAKDVKNEVRFNKEVVESYRLIGYENKQISQDDFENDNTDSGEVGSNHQTVVVYEIEMYDLESQTETDIEICNLHIKYKDPVYNENKEYINNFTKNELTINSTFDLDEINFVLSIVEFALLLRKSDYRGSANYEHLSQSLRNNSSVNNNETRLEFLELVDLALKKDMISESVPEKNQKIITVVMENAIISVVVDNHYSLTVQSLITNIFGVCEDNKYNYQISFDSEFNSIFVPTIVSDNMVLYLKISAK